MSQVFVVWSLVPSALWRKFTQHMESLSSGKGAVWLKTDRGKERKIREGTVASSCESFSKVNRKSGSNVIGDTQRRL